MKHLFQRFFAVFSGVHLIAGTLQHFGVKTADPGAKMMSQFMGWNWLYNGTADTYLGLSAAWGSFVIATIANIIAFLFVVFGIKLFARVQKVVMTLGIGGALVIVVVLLMYSKSQCELPHLCGR